MVLRFLGVLLALLMTQGFTEEQSQHFSANRTAIRDLYSEMTTFDPLISTKCNPDSGSCKCLESWGVDGACYKLQTRFRATNATRPSVTIEVDPEFWLAKETPAGLYDCRNSICDVRHGANNACMYARFESKLGAALGEQAGSVVVHEVLPGSASAAQGVRGGMRIKSVNTEPVFTVQETLDACIKSLPVPFTVEFCGGGVVVEEQDREYDAYVFDGCSGVTDIDSLQWPEEALARAEGTARKNVAIILENQQRFFDSETLYMRRLADLFWAQTDLVMGHVPHAGKDFLELSYLDHPGEAFRLPPLAFAQKRTGVAWFSSQCDTTFAGKRLERVDALMQLLEIDAFGKCRHNADIDEKLPHCASATLAREDVNRDPSKECVLWSYKFYIAFENSEQPGYMTEKLWQGLKVGSVPIYWGAPDVLEFLPDPAAIVNARDFDSMEALAEYVKQALHNETLYERHLQWKTRPFKQKFADSMLDKGRGKLFCSLCDHLSESLGDGSAGGPPRRRRGVGSGPDRREREMAAAAAAGGSSPADEF